MNAKNGATNLTKLVNAFLNTTTKISGNKRIFEKLNHSYGAGSE